jgi:hypothetical protein
VTNIIINSKDRAPRYSASEHAIRVLSAELVRLTRLPYSSWKNLDRIRSLDKQIEYLEHMLAGYEQDQKKF